MGLVIENLLRTTELDADERDVCLRGIAQVAMADGVDDPRERAYLNQFVTEFFQDADATDEKLNSPIADGDLAKLKSDDTKRAFIGYAYITAYIDEDFDKTEKDLIDKWADQLLTDEQWKEVAASVREFLYRRSVFAYAFRLGRLDEGFAVKAAERFDVPVERAKEINAGVFNAIMALRRPADDADDEAAAG